MTGGIDYSQMVIIRERHVKARTHQTSSFQFAGGPLGISISRMRKAGSLQLKEAAAVAKIPHHRVLTDLTGDFNRVILEYEAENVGEFEARMRDYATNATFRRR